MRKSLKLLRSNTKLADITWGAVSEAAVGSLKDLTEKYRLSVAAGDLQFLDGRWYVTHAGLLRVAERRRCCGIRTVIEKDLSDPITNRWVFRATVFKSPRSREVSSATVTPIPPTRLP